MRDLPQRQDPLRRRSRFGHQDQARPYGRIESNRRTLDGGVLQVPARRQHVLLGRPRTDVPPPSSARSSRVNATGADDIRRVSLSIRMSVEEKEEVAATLPPLQVVRDADDADGAGRHLAFVPYHVRGGCNIRPSRGSCQRVCWEDDASRCDETVFAHEGADGVCSRSARCAARPASCTTTFTGTTS